MAESIPVRIILVVAGLLIQATGLRVVITESRLLLPLEFLSTVYDGNATIYIIGGRGISSNDQVMKYSLETGVVEFVGHLPRTLGTAVMDGEDIIYFGGIDGKSNVYKTTKISRYSTRTNTHSVVSNLTQPLGFMGCSWSSYSRTAYIFGGSRDNGTGTDQVLLFNAINDNLIEMEPRMPKPRHSMSAVWASGRDVAFIFGGNTGIDYKTHDIMKFDPTTNDVAMVIATLPFTTAFTCSVFAAETQEAYIISNSGLIRFSIITEQASQVEVENWPGDLDKMSCVYVSRLDRIYMLGGLGRYSGGANDYRNEIAYIDLHTRATEPPTTKVTNPPAISTESEASRIPTASTDTQENTTVEEITSGTHTTDIAAPTMETDEPTSRPLSSIIYYALATFIFTLLLLLLAGLAMWRSRLRKNAPNNHPEVPGLSLVTYLRLKPLITNACRKFELQQKDFRVHRTSDAILGRGEFGVILEASVKGIRVVAKTVGEGVTDLASWKALLQEVRVTAQVSPNENVVALVGAHTHHLRKGVCFVFFEFCAKGSLESYIENYRHTFECIPKRMQVIPAAPGYIDLVPIPMTPLPSSPFRDLDADILTPEHLHKWSAHICAGMAHLTSHHIVHADLATRNILLTDRLVAKVSDFGLSQKLYDSCRVYIADTSSGSNSTIKIPWQHMAPEALTQLRFSEQSDVWAFGVTMWQIYTLGESPYSPLEYSRALVERLVNGMRLRQPAHASKDIYALMQSCWALDPHARPSFIDLHANLRPVDG